MKISGKFILKNVGNESMLLPVNNDFMSVKNIITLNETSLEIYTLLKDGLNEEEIVERMLKDYNVDKEVLKKDVSDVIERFISLGVLDV
ncbi:MAG: PqqD family protein [Erysipelotrichales bacterium]|nr:PqqD family protein [Erysipelotrichales bacterium]